MFIHVYSVVSNLGDPSSVTRECSGTGRGVSLCK